MQFIKKFIIVVKKFKMNNITIITTLKG